MRSPDQSEDQNNALNTAAASSAAGTGAHNYPADATRVVDTRITRTDGYHTDGYYTADEDTTLLQPTRTLGHGTAPTKAELQATPEPPFAAGLRRFLTMVM